MPNYSHNGEKTRICKICGLRKPLADFNVTTIGYITKYDYMCRSCKNIIEEDEGGGGKGKKQALDYYAKRFATEQQEKRAESVEQDKLEAREGMDETSTKTKKDKSTKTDGSKKDSAAKAEKHRDELVAKEIQKQTEKTERSQQQVKQEKRRITVGMDNEIRVFDYHGSQAYSPHLYSADQTRFDIVMRKVYLDTIRGTSPTDKANHAAEKTFFTKNSHTQPNVKQSNSLLSFVAKTLGIKNR
jgi:hypothetical protein